MRFLANFFSYERGPCQVMAGLRFQTIRVTYGPAIINDTVREAQSKIWLVAARTQQPDKTCANHASWMVEIQQLRAETIERIGETESRHIRQDIIPYMNGLK